MLAHQGGHRRSPAGSRDDRARVGRSVNGPSRPSRPTAIGHSRAGANRLVCSVPQPDRVGQGGKGFERARASRVELVISRGENRMSANATLASCLPRRGPSVGQSVSRRTRFAPELPRGASGNVSHVTPWKAGQPAPPLHDPQWAIEAKAPRRVRFALTDRHGGLLSAWRSA